MRLLKKYCHRMNLTACAIECTKMVGADLYIRPKVPSCTNSTATRHLVLVSTNEMDELCADMVQPPRQIKPPIEPVGQSA